MRHGKKINHLGRTASHRSAMLSNMASSLILHKRINTTLAKAKALRGFIEPIINRSKENTTLNRRVSFSYLGSNTAAKEAVKELFDVIAEKIAARPGGYTRIIKLGIRIGDNAEQAMIELVDFNEIYGKGKGEAAAPAKKTRRAGGAKKKAAEKETAAPSAEQASASAEEAPAE
jgi:large subunit ribosomal protein L17